MAVAGDGNGISAAPTDPAAADPVASHRQQQQQKKAVADGNPSAGMGLLVDTYISSSADLQANTGHDPRPRESLAELLGLIDTMLNGS